MDYHRSDGSSGDTVTDTTDNSKHGDCYSNEEVDRLILETMWQGIYVLPHPCKIKYKMNERRKFNGYFG